MTAAARRRTSSRRAATCSTTGSTITFPGALQGATRSRRSRTLQRGVYQQFQQAFGEPSQSPVEPESRPVRAGRMAAPVATVTVNAGLRYDLQWLPDPVQLDANNVSPRARRRWAPGDGETVVRASGGRLLRSHAAARDLERAAARRHRKYRVAVLSFGQPGAPRFPDGAAGVSGGRAVRDHDDRSGTSRTGAAAQAALQVERALGRSVSAHGRLQLPARARASSCRATSTCRR